MKKRPEWISYRVGKPSSDPNRTNTDCCPLDSVYHICHVSDAYRIFEDMRIRASLVGDESRLKKTRSCVTWLSPDTWVNGSFYGNIRFDFHWRELVAGKSFYWVEAMNYSPTAYRILITADKPSLDLERYHPEDGDGPLYRDPNNGRWYCNRDLTGEFMLDEDLWLQECQTIAFENHHPPSAKETARLVTSEVRSGTVRGPACCPVLSRRTY